MRISVFGGVVALIAATTGSASAQGLTLQEVLDRARARAPEVLAAMARVDEARAQLLGASVRFRDNPVIDVDTGPRSGPERRTWDYSVSASQTFETGGQRDARMASAQAEVTRSLASADETARTVMRDVAVAYVRAVAADQRVRLLQAAEDITVQLQAASERRYQAGDIAALDVNLTRIAAARAKAERMAAEAERAEAIRPLRVVLGLDVAAPLVLAGSLERTPAPREVLVAAVEQAPALRASTAEIARAEADARLGAALRRPDLGASLNTRREQDDQIFTGGVSITLPLFDNGQGVRAEAEARVRRLSLERDAVRRTLQIEIDAGLALFEQRRAVAETLRTSALPSADDNESLATRSLDAGEMSLLNFLLVRQDVTTTRLAYVEALAEAAAASIDVDAAAGVLR